MRFDIVGYFARKAIALDFNRIGVRRAVFNILIPVILKRVFFCGSVYIR
jgi:hypothetical protein